MKKKIKTFLKKKSPYYIANIFLISIILFIGIMYSIGIFNNKYKEIKEQSKYYNEEYFFNNINTNINTENISKLSSSTITEILNSTASSSNLNIIQNEDTNNDSIILKTGYYLQIKNSCDAGYAGSCVRARVCPSLSCPAEISLRDGIVLKTDGKITYADGINWYHIVFDEWVRYPERLTKDLYISSEYVDLIQGYKAYYKKNEEIKNISNKKIIVNLTEQKLYAYAGDKLFMETNVSSGLEDLPTPRGTFHIYEKTPSRYMQGPLPNISDQYYDLPGVPWTMYFTVGGAALHGAYWHNNFGKEWSHGCVNLRTGDSEKLYNWAPMGTTVIVKD